MDYEVIDREGGGGHIEIGDGTKIARRVSIDISANVTIGEKCLISEDVVILTHDHDLYDFMDKTKIVSSPIRIHNRVFIGIGAIITNNVEFIGDDAFIGAGAVVTKSVSSRFVMAGNPAKRIGYKYGNKHV